MCTVVHPNLTEIDTHILFDITQLPKAQSSQTPPITKLLTLLYEEKPSAKTKQYKQPVMRLYYHISRVCDFGLRGLREAGSILGSGSTAPLAAWTAPEVLDDQEPSVLSDVYSFGILIHEVLTQRVPFAGKGVAKVLYCSAHGRDALVGASSFCFLLSCQTLSTVKTDF